MLQLQLARSSLARRAYPLASPFTELRAISQPLKPDLSGTVIESRFEIGAKLGAGGMGAVYEGRQLDLDRKVAIKIIAKSAANTPESRRFQNESKLLCRIDHPNVVKVFAAGDTTSFDFIVMDYAAGKSLGSLIAERKFTVEETVLVAKQMAAALAALHESHILHRDVKPQNIMVSGEGENMKAVLVDFGLAKTTDIDEQKLTKTGSIIGTPLYMSPEQCASGSPDERSDIYSLGCVLFEMLDGKPPFVGDTAFALFHAHLYEPARLLTLSTPWFAAVIKKMLCKDPSQRYQSMDELNAALQAKSAPEDNARENEVERNYTKLAAMVAALLISGITAGFALLNSHPEESTPPTIPSQAPGNPTVTNLGDAEEKELSAIQKKATTIPELRQALLRFYQRRKQTDQTPKLLRDKIISLGPEFPREASELAWIAYQKEQQPERKQYWAINALMMLVSYDKQPDLALIQQRADETNELLRKTPSKLAAQQAAGINKRIAMELQVPACLPYHEQAIYYFDRADAPSEVLKQFNVMISTYEKAYQYNASAKTRIRSFNYAIEHKYHGEKLESAFTQLALAAQSLYLHENYNEALRAAKLYHATEMSETARAKKLNTRSIRHLPATTVVSACCYYKLGDIPKAKAECELAMQFPPYPSRTTSKQWEKRAQLLLALTSGLLGQSTKMASLIDQSTTMPPDSASLDSATFYLKISEIYQNQSQLGSAKRCATLALRDAELAKVTDPTLIESLKKRLVEL